MKDILVKERYRVDYKIGEGGFGLVYAGTDTQSGEEVAIKMMDMKNDDFDILQNEADVYAALSGGTGIPRVMWFGGEGDYNVLVHEMLGPSLEDLFNYCDRSFSLKTVLLIADQILARIKHIHDGGYLHRDVKPENLLMGVGTRGNTVYMIDFGLAEDFGETDERDAPGEGRPFTGTRRYASRNADEGREQSWRDDLESIGYVLLHFLRGSLPWQGLKAATESDKDKLIKEKKLAVSAEDLCEGLPVEFVRYMDYVRSLRFNQRPDYGNLQRQFRRLFTAQGFKYDNVYDWTEKLFHEAHENATNP